MTWSFTKLKDYETCPRLCNEKWHLKSFKEVDGDAAKWGHTVHKALEKRAAGEPLPEPLAKHETKIGGLIDAARAAGAAVFAEQKLGLNQRLEACDFFAKDVWWRGKADLTLLSVGYAATFDYKTGKRKDDTTQLDLISGALFAKYPQVRVIEAKFLWLAGGEPTGKKIERSEMPKVWQSIMPRVMRMECDETFDPKPNGLCRQYCQVTQCPHNGRYGK